jgi:PKD repeat protein
MHNTKPTPKFKATNDAVTSLKVNFDATDTVCGSGVCTYSWNYGQTGGTTTGDGTVTPSHTYTSTGTFNVTLTVTDTGFGTSASITKPVMPINVAPPPPPPPATYTVSGQVVRLDGTTAVPTATVRLYQGSTVKCSTSSNTLGNFTCSNIAAGSYTIQVTKTGLTFAYSGAAGFTPPNTLDAATITGLKATGNR